MSNLSGSNSNGAPSFLEFKKQASFFLKEKIKSARLVLTDVTPAQLLTEEATNGKPWAPDTRTLGSISKASFELDDYTRIVEILHKRLLKFERKNWRESYNSIVVLEHLLTHGPESVAVEFEVDKDVIEQMGSFHHIDEKGFNWGLALRKKSGGTLKLLEKGNFLKEERERARKLTRGIQGFGSFCQRSSDSSAQGILRESAFGKYGRSKSQSLSSNDENQENELPLTKIEDYNKTIGESKASKQSNQGSFIVEAGIDKEAENSSSCGRFGDDELAGQPETLTRFKENMAPKDLDVWDCIEDSNPLLVDDKNESRIELSAEDEHPFSDTNNQSVTSLLAVSTA